MIKRFKDFAYRVMAETAISRAEFDNAKAQENGTEPWTPSFDDRRRMAVAEIFVLAERKGQLTPGDLGTAVLNNSISEDEIIPLADLTTQATMLRISSGRLG